jgi:gamma-glutamylcyclotransferase (GGCT)/AIG2-like uncharacterized protein YtfP
MNKMYYFAYGMNTNKSGMRQRCPAAVSIGSSVLQNYEFRFAMHADVVPKQDARTVGVLWELTPACLQALDRLESYPHYYDRKMVDVLYHDRLYEAWVYTMQPGNPESPPHSSYWECLLEGYKEHDVSKKQLYRALDSSYRADIYGRDHWDSKDVLSH